MRSGLILFAIIFLSFQVIASEYQFGFNKEFKEAYFKKDKNNQHLWIPYEVMIRQRIDTIKLRPTDKDENVYLLEAKFPIVDKKPQQKSTCTVQDAYNTGFVAAPIYSEATVAKFEKCGYIKMQGYCYKNESKEECKKILKDIMYIHFSIAAHSDANQINNSPLGSN